MRATPTSPGRPGLPLAVRLEGGSTTVDSRKAHRRGIASDHFGAVQARDAQEGGAAETTTAEELLTPARLWDALIQRTDRASISSWPGRV